MKRRKFLLTSGTAILGSTAVQSISQEPAVALNFDLVGVENVQPSNTDTILVDFQNFELVPKYVDETAEDATVTITLDIEGNNKVQNQIDVSITNGNTINRSDLDSTVPIVQDNISSAQTALDGYVEISIDHPDVSDLYKQSFTITDDSLQQGLVGYWPLHEWFGQAGDLSGNENHGTVNGSNRGVSGRSSLTSYSFNGSSDHIDMSSSPIQNLDTDWSVSMWFYTKDSSVFGPMFDLKNSGVQLVSHDSLKLRWWLEDNTNFNISQLELDENKWYHAVVTHDESSDEFELFVNGTKIGSEEVGGDIRERSDVLTVGAQNNENNLFPGKISEFRVYDRKISNDEVEKLYNLGTGDYTDSSLHDGSDSGAVSRWRFEDDLNDSWSSNNGTDSTSTGFSANSIRGNSKQFDGSDDEITFDNSSSPDLDNFTISFWYYIDSIGDEIVGALGKWEDISDATTNNSNFLFQFENRSNASNPAVRLLLGDASSSAAVDTRPQSIQTGSWSHIVGTYDGSEMRIYYNGVLDETNETSITPNQTSNDVMKFANDMYDRYLNGKLEDIRIYDRALSLDEVQQLYQWGTRGEDLRERTTTKNKSNMVGWWKLNETNGSTAYDSSGNGYDASSFGAGPSDSGTSDSPISQSAYNFDGDDYVKSEDTFYPLADNTISLSAWVKFDTLGFEEWFSAFYVDGNNLFSLFKDSSDYPRCFIQGSGSNTEARSSMKVNKNEWYHIAGIGVGNVARIYVNGQNTKTASDSGDLSNITSDGRIDIGRFEAAGGRNLDGYLADVRLYNRVLTSQEVSYLYEQKF